MALRRFGAALLTFVVAIAVLVPALRSDPARTPVKRPLPSPKAALAKLPLAFAPNDGAYTASTGGLRIDLDQRGAQISSSGRLTLRARFSGSKPSRPRAESKLRGILN